MKSKNPLVSILIPNRNHSMYLENCIESALNQTYNNVEIIVLDNCSTDNSVEIVSKYFDVGVRVCKNPINLANKSINLLSFLSKGKYLMTLFADDMIKPTLVDKCVRIMETQPKVGYVHCERDFINDVGKITDLDPFYNCSFISPGESALPIYLLADVAQTAQCLMRREAFNKALGYSSEFDHLNTDKDLWFRLSLVSDYAYIREKLALIRIHESRETVRAYRNFYHPLALYLTLNHQAKLGFEQEGHKNVIEKMPVAYKKLAMESLKIALFIIREKNLKLAKQYMLFAEILSNDIVEDELYLRCHKYYDRLEKNGDQNIPCLEEDMYIKRKRNYEPPKGFVKINLENYAN